MNCIHRQICKHLVKISEAVRPIIPTRYGPVNEEYKNLIEKICDECQFKSEKEPKEMRWKTF